MKKILSLTIFALVALASCKKDKGFENSEYGFKPVALNDMPIVQILEGGLAKFKAQTIKPDLSKTSDTSYFTIYYIDKNLPAPSDVTVTIAYDAAALALYNTKNPSTVFEKLPDSTYKFTTTTVLIKAGEKFSNRIPVIVFPEKIDPSKLYMLPITITSVSNGAIISTNNSTIFFHIIGNPFASDYTWDFYRWNNADGSGPTAGGTFTGDVATFQAVSDVSFKVASGYFIGPEYLVTFTKTGPTTYTNFSVVMDPASVKALSDAGVSITSAPKFLIVDPVAKHFKMQYVVFNGTSSRYLIDDYYK